MWTDLCGFTTRDQNFALKTMWRQFARRWFWKSRPWLRLGCLAAFVSTVMTGSWGSKDILDFVFIEGSTLLVLGKSISAGEITAVESNGLGRECDSKGFYLASPLGYIVLSVKSDVWSIMDNWDGFSTSGDGNGPSRGKTRKSRRFTRG